MATIVVPFRGEGKRRLAPLPHDSRAQLALAMLADVLGACVQVGETLLVTSDAAAQVAARELGLAARNDPGGGQGAAVAAALEGVGRGPVLVVNADLPCVEPLDLVALLEAMPPGGLALAAARDGTTNALALAEPRLFAPVYGPGSATRFREHATRLGIEAALVTLPNLVDDVDTLADLERVEARLRTRTRAAFRALRVGAVV